jgi:hypothetical protein
MTDLGLLMKLHLVDGTYEEKLRASTLTGDFTSVSDRVRPPPTG